MVKALSFCMFFLFAGLLIQPGAAAVPDEGPFRLVYFEGGEYGEYRNSLYGLLTAFHKHGLLAEAPDSDLDTSRKLWDWAAEQDSSSLHFSKEGYYTTHWEKDQREAVSNRLYRDLADGKADMVLAMGTWAGLDLKEKDPGVPVVVMAVSDAISAGMFNNDKPGDPPWLHVRMDPKRDERQLRIFHDTVGFDTLGVVYKDTVEGKSYAALDTVRAVSRQRNFHVETCAIPDGKDQGREETLLLECYRQLSEKADAFYVTAIRALNEKTFPSLVKLALEKQIPSFSQSGSKEVQAGLLMSISQASFSYVGDFTAKIIMRIMKGEEPGSLPMVFEDPPSIAINMSTAKRIDYDIPVDVLSASDQIFLEKEDYGDL